MINKLLVIILPKLLLISLSFAVLPAHSQVLGNLFTTPAERAYLDQLRQEFLTATQEANFDISDSTPPPLITQDNDEINPAIVDFHLGAIINRNNKGATIWLNNEAISENELPSNFRLINSGTILAIKTEERELFLKPGQSINVLSGLVNESPQMNEPITSNVDNAFIESSPMSISSKEGAITDDNLALIPGTDAPQKIQKAMSEQGE